MKNRKWIVVAGVWVALALITLATGCGPALNNFMSYQGRLTDDGGNPINGTRNITFRLYGAETGGTAIWEETHGGVQVNNGLFNVVLGANTALDEANFHQPLFLEVEVAGQTLSPRQQLLGAPYAFSLVPGAVVKGSISASETFSSTLNVFNWGDGQGIAVGSNGTALVASGGSECGNHGVYGQTGGDWCWSSGVYGKATKDHALGVTGWNTAAGDGVLGVSAAGDGVRGTTDAGNKSGVYGHSTDGFGITGRSANSIGVQGFSTNGLAGNFRGGLAGLYAKSEGDGYAAGFYNNTTAANEEYKSTIWLVNGGSGDLIWAAGGGSELDFRVTAGGHVYSDQGFDTPASDFAELISVEGEKDAYEPGDVLVISENMDRAVRLSSTPYSTAVVGIYSTQPGFLGGSADEGEPNRIDGIPVAISGIVPCKVSAESGPIHRGDLLTTSSTPGHAMKATESKLGAILGKAFGELESGTGVIYVLVTLQ